MNKLRAIAIIVASAMLSACSLLPQRQIQHSLTDVVDAVQYAVDQAAADEVWKATAVEIEHWSKVCNSARQEVAKSCLTMLDAADSMCRAACPSGQCGLAQQERCRRYAEGLDEEVQCAKITDANRDWCKAAGSCNAGKKDVGERCGALQSIRLPALKEAKLSLAVAETTQAGGTITILVVSFGASSSRVSTNTVDLTLVPRVRSRAYNSDVLPKIPDSKVMSANAIKWAAELKKLIVDAVHSTVKEYAGAGKDEVAARPPMALSALEIGFSIVIDANGKLGLKQTWTTPALGVDLSAGGGVKTTNSLKIIYARPN